MNEIFWLLAGIVCDRLWQSFANRRRLRIKTKVFTSCEGKGVEVVVENLGRTELPAYDLVISNPTHRLVGSFDSDQSRPLGPGQVRNHRCVVVERSGKASWTLGWVLNPNDSNHSFSLQVANSEREIFKDSRMGAELVKLIRRIAEARSVAIATDDIEWKNLRHPRTASRRPLPSVRSVKISRSRSV